MMKVRASNLPVVPLALLLLLAAGARGDPAESESAARQAVQETVDAVLVVLRDAALPLQEKRRKVEEIVYERFDFATISRLVLARNYRKLSEAQREQFLGEFQRHLSLTYGDGLEEYRDENVEIERTRHEKNDDVTVFTRVVGELPEPYLIDYRLRRNGTGDWLVIDVVIEDVSMVSNFRTQVQEIISAHGADSLVEKLRAKNDARGAQKES